MAQAFHLFKSHNQVSPSDDGHDSLREDPGDSTEYDVDEAVPQMQESKGPKKKKKSSTLKNLTKTTVTLKQKNAFQLIRNAGIYASRWKDYVTTKREELLIDYQNKQLPETSKSGPSDQKRKVGGLGLKTDIDPPRFPHSYLVDMTSKNPNQVITVNRNLLEYFALLGKSMNPKDTIDLDYLDQLFENGALVNCSDKYGQTVLHEVARAWHPDVAKYLISKGADPCQADDYGKTPLHVAAATDYPLMVDTLIQHGADKEALTKGELQTSMHYAAKNDAWRSLKTLLRHGCKYNGIKDFKGRTPLQVAAELDRSETARLLLELPEPASMGVADDSNLAVVTLMIIKMPSVAKLGLDQLLVKDRSNRRQYFYLNRLEPQQQEKGSVKYPRTALQVVVSFQRYDLIEHPILLKLIDIKWKKFGRFGAVKSLLVNFMFILLWTLQGILVEYDQRYIYKLPQQWWRIVLFCLALFFTGWQVMDELMEYYYSHKGHQRWKKWKMDEIDRDRQFCHPRWPEESAYLEKESQELDELRPRYFSDYWNVFDWVCYFLLFVCIGTHVGDIVHHTIAISRAHIRIMSVTVILLWVRLLKNARPFGYLGPFVVMLLHMFGDVAKFAIIYLQFYLPFCCAFWMLFGGTKVPEAYLGEVDQSNYTTTVEGFETVDALLFSMFRLTLVDSYDYYGLKAIDSIMADILIGTWLALSAILMLNLFIALLSDTFQRVYDNARANAIMQKAITILSIEEGMSDEKRDKHRLFVNTKCAPLENYYDDDQAELSEDLQKVTIQIKEQLDGMEEKLHSGAYQLSGQQNKATANESSKSPAGDPPPSNVSNGDMTDIQKELAELRRAQFKMYRRVRQEFSLIREALTALTQGNPVVLPQAATFARSLTLRKRLTKSSDWHHEADMQRRGLQGQTAIQGRTNVNLEVSELPIPMSDPPSYDSTPVKSSSVQHELPADAGQSDA